MNPKDADSLETRLAAQLKRRRLDGRLRRLNTRPKDMRDFSSNSYLSLAANPEIIESYLSSVASSAGLGCGGSRLLDGNSALAESLEQDIASFHRAPTGLLFNSGFEANVGLFSCVPDVNDVIVYDELIHASVHDGMRMSRAKKKVAFAHNVVGDGPDGQATHKTAPRSLYSVLRSITDLAMAGESARRLQKGEANVFVAVEGLYSMDGDVAPLKQILDCVERVLPLGNGYVIVDEAHSTGFFGENGRGLVCDLGLEQRVWARLHTFGKAMGCSGAIVLCSPIVREYLINYARSLIYTTAMSPPTLTAIRVTYDFIAHGKAKPLVSRLRLLISRVHGQLEAICARNIEATMLGVLRWQPGHEMSPIIPVFTTNPRELAGYCQNRGFMVRPVVPPTVPKGTERVRICLHAANTPEEVDSLCKVIEEWTSRQMRQMSCL